MPTSERHEVFHVSVQFHTGKHFNRMQIERSLWQRCSLQTQRSSVESGGYAALISLVNIFVSALVVIFDAIFRSAFLGIRMFCRNEQTNASFSTLVRRIVTRRIQVSYVTRQLNILSGVFLLMMVWLRPCIDRLDIDGSVTFKSMLMSTMKASVALSRSRDNLLLAIKNCRRPFCHQHVQNWKGSATIPGRVFSDGTDAVAGDSIR